MEVLEFFKIEGESRRKRENTPGRTQKTIRQRGQSEANGFQGQETAGRDVSRLTSGTAKTGLTKNSRDITDSWSQARRQGGLYVHKRLVPILKRRNTMSVTSITDTRQYLTFQLGEEIFGLDVSHVREILEFTTVTKVPKTPDYMRGVINLRGSVVPVLDMRFKFGLTQTEKTVNTCIIVVEVSFEG